VKLKFSLIFVDNDIFYFIINFLSIFLQRAKKFLTLLCHFYGNLLLFFRKSVFVVI